MNLVLSWASPRGASKLNKIGCLTIIEKYIIINVFAGNVK